MNFPQGFLAKYQAQLSETDFDEFVQYCQKPLRKSIRVNTLKISVADFLQIAKEKDWELEQIPWCESGFWIERENREESLGNSIEHFLGLFYIQEASSMLPPEILNPQPNEIVLDMAAAPGSKTTQLAGKMQNQGVLVSNEPIVKRIKGMVSNLERLGASCAVVSRKEGQFFGENAPNFFDKILLDAPCTGEGTVRKDSKALDNWSQENIEGMARLQKQLIKSAFEALKPGGEMVYSTCTLAKEENQEVIQYLLQEFQGNAELVPFFLVPLEKGDTGGLKPKEELQNPPNPLYQGGFNASGMFTVWPQLFDSEGFFVAKIRKNFKTEFEKPKKQNHFVSKYRVLRNNEIDLIQAVLVEQFGYIEKLVKNYKLYQKENQIYFCPKEIRSIDEKVYLERRGFEVGEFLHKRNGATEFKINHLGITLLGKDFTKNVLELSEEEVQKYLKGENIELDSCLRRNDNLWGGVFPQDGLVVLKYRNVIFGKGLLKANSIKNQIPRYLIW